MTVAMVEETPTGIDPAAIEEADRTAKVAVARWHLEVCGRDAAAMFTPRAIRDLTFEQRLHLATHPEVFRAWEVRERRRVARSPRYFIAAYGSLQPEEGGAIPFDTWPEQDETIDLMAASLRFLALKARQLGLTWLAIHYAFWKMAFDPRTPKFRVLALSKKGDDANELIDRARGLNDRLPSFLRQKESRSTKDSNSRFRLLDRGSEMRSLMGTPEAARSYTAGLAILDEFGFYRNGQAPKVLTSVQPTLGERGQAFIISTGNGTAGDGAALATVWTGAIEGENEWAPQFLAAEVHPARRAAGWRERKRREYLADEDFEAEFPENPEQALAGKGSFHVYPPAGIAAALRLGALLEPLLPDLIEDGVEWGIDWGDFQTFAVYAVGLPNGGAFIFDELVQAHVEPAKAAEAIIYRDAAGIPGLRYTDSSADKAPLGTNRTFARVLREAHEVDPNRWPERHTTIPFGTYKEGGGQTNTRKGGVNTVAYIRALLDKAESYGGPPEEAAGLLALSPRLSILPAQMRNLERDADTGKVRKPALDPRRIEFGDHGPDAVVALMASRAKRWRASID